MGIDLARRAIHAPAWRWLPGMRTTDGFRVTSGPHRANILGTDYANVWLASENPTEEDRYDLRGEEIAGLPDLTDAATLGCLLALVREAASAETQAIVAAAQAHSPRFILGSTFPEPMPERPRPVGDRFVQALTRLAMTHDPVAISLAAESLVLALEAAPVRR